MTNKERYAEFCRQTYVPVYSQPWWMDVVCGGAENWDVWLYESGGNILAAMPYYMERRGIEKQYRYITKAPLTQNNGIIFREEPARRRVSEAEFEEKVIQAACDFIASLGLDVYEQQYHHSFQNWSPFFWNNYTCVLRYSYILEDTSDLEKIMEGVSATYRNQIRKGQRITHASTEIDRDTFFTEHEKVFLKQGLPCPFSYDFWCRLQDTCAAHDAGQMFCAKDDEGNIHAVMYLVWDARSAYLLLGGSMPEYSHTQGYPALMVHGIRFAGQKGLSFDFEGSMIHRVAKSFRQFGGTPMPYYRIRKVFNPEIVRHEAEAYIQKLRQETQDV